MINFQGTELRVYYANRPRYDNEENNSDTTPTRKDTKSENILLVKGIPSIGQYQEHTLNDKEFGRLEFESSGYEPNVWFMRVYKDKICIQKFMVYTEEYNNIIKMIKKLNIPYKIID